eukprot:5224130-Pyramimonas_sp.AAC.1
MDTKNERVARGGKKPETGDGTGGQRALDSESEGATEMGTPPSMGKPVGLGAPKYTRVLLLKACWRDPPTRQSLENGKGPGWRKEGESGSHIVSRNR